MAFGLRATWGVVQGARAEPEGALEFPDEEQYWRMAGSLWHGEGLEDELGFRATRMPLYPAILAPFTGLPDGILLVRGFHWLIGAGVAALTAGLAAGLGRKVGLVAGLLVAFDPFLIFFSSLLLTETAFIAALLGLWWALSSSVNRRLDNDTAVPSRIPTPSPLPLSLKGRGVHATGCRWVVVGVLAAVCVYLRESSAGLVVVSIVFAVAWQGFSKTALLGGAAAGSIVILALVPWAARNRAVTGDWCWLTHRGGISLYDGVRPNATGASDLGDVKRGEAVAGLDEIAWDRYFWHEATEAIRSDPRRIGRLALVKLGRMWNPLPNVETYQSTLMRAVSAGWMVPVYLLAAVGIATLSIQYRRAGVRAAIFLLLPALYFSVLHSLFVGSVRYRLPAMPILEILAAVSVASAYNRWLARRGVAATACGAGARPA